MLRNDREYALGDVRMDRVCVGIKNVKNISSLLRHCRGSLKTAHEDNKDAFIKISDDHWKIDVFDECSKIIALTNAGIKFNIRYYKKKIY